MKPHFSNTSLLKLSAGALLSGTFLWAGCSSTPLSEKYALLDGDQKSAFIQAYPKMTPDERGDFLDNPDSGEAPQDTQKTLTALRIQPEKQMPVLEGSTLRLKAYALYGHTHQIDVTEDVLFQAFPDSARMTGNILKFGCTYSDITVSANFFGAAETTETFAIRKPIQTLDVKVSESSLTVDDEEFIKLEVTANCKDGTSQNVSCHADWSVPLQEGSFAPCGHLHPTPAAFNNGTVTVTAKYGTLSITRTLNLPKRLSN